MVRRYWILLAVSLFFLAYVSFNWSPSKMERPQNSAAVFSLSALELKQLKAKAVGGDCEAAFRVAHYYNFSTENYEEAVNWLRNAAKCGKLEAKTELIYMLIGRKNDPNVSKEIDMWISSIERENPQQAEVVRGAIGYK